VVFLGFTTNDHEQACAFTSETGITWPNAYEIESLSKASPNIYVIGTDGLVSWSDERSRYRHALYNFRVNIEAAIERALKHATAATRPPTEAVTGSRAVMPPHGG
jgi:hypothetical protein